MLEMTLLPRGWGSPPEARGKAGGAVKESPTSCPQCCLTPVGPIGLIGSPPCEDASIPPCLHARRWEAEQVQSLTFKSQPRMLRRTTALPKSIH